MANTFNILLTTETAPRVGAGFGMRAIRVAGPGTGRVYSPVAIAMSDRAAIRHDVFTDAGNLDALAARGAG